MTIRKSYRPLLTIIFVTIVAGVLTFVFLARTKTIVRAPGIVYPHSYVDLRAPVSLGRVMKVLKTSGEQVKAGEDLLELDSEDDVLLHELELKKISGLKDLIKEHAAVLETRKAAVALAKAAEEQAVAAIATLKGKATAAEAAVKRAGPAASDVEVNIATRQLDMAAKSEEEAKLTVENFVKMVAKNAATEFELRMARLAQEKAQTLTVQTRDRLDLLKNSDTVFRLEEAKGKVEEFAGAIKAAEATVGVKKAELHAAELALTVDEEGKRLAGELEALIIEEKRLDRQLKEKVLRAPISGLLTEFRIRPGQWIADRDPLGTIYDVSELIIYAHVQQKDVTRIEPGQKAKVAFDAFSRDEGSIPATVLSIEALATPPKADSIEPTALLQEPMKGTWTPRAIVKLKLGDSPHNAKLKVGFTGAVKILVDPNNSLADWFFR